MIFLTVLSTFSMVAPQVKAQGVWISKASMPTARYSMAAVFYEGEIYVIGGEDDSGGSPIMLSTLEVYDPLTDTWSSKTPMPTPRNRVGAAVISDKIYVVGYDNITYCYDPATDSWSERAKIPLPLHPSTWRQAIGVGVINSKMYVSPGEPWMYCYDPSTDTWTEKACVPSTGGRPHDIQGFAVLNDKLYAFGDTYTTRVDVYDPVTDTWTAGAIPDIPSVRTHLGPTIPVLNGKIYVIGGWNGGSAQSTVLVYDQATNSWSTETPMPTARWGPAYAIANGKIYVIGGNWGGAGGHPQSLNEEFTPPAPPPEDLDPWEYCPYVYMDYGYGFPWDTTPDLPVNVLYTGTYFWGDLRVIQYWFHWNVDYMWWPPGFLKSAIDYTRGEAWVNPLRQPVKQHDWEPIIIIVNDEGFINYVLWRLHWNWLMFDLTIPGAELFHPTYEETHIKLWWAIGCHTPLTKYFAIDIPILLKIASLLKTPEQFNPVIGQEGDLIKPPLYEVYEQGITYPCGMQEWDKDLALSLGFDPADLQYVNNPTLAYSEVSLVTAILKIFVESPVNILVTAPDGLRVGYDSVTQTVVNEIEGATYSGPGTEPQVVDIPSPLPGVYDIDVVGTDSGVYTITIWSMAEDGFVAGIETDGGETVEGDVDHYSASISETGEIEVFSWEYVFEDGKRGTILKISTDDKHFQFIAPDKEFSIKEAYKMKLYKHSIIIWHKDEEIKLVTIAIDTRIDFCFAYAKDMQTGDKYLLIDKPGIE